MKRASEGYQVRNKAVQERLSRVQSYYCRREAQQEEAGEASGEEEAVGCGRGGEAKGGSPGYEEEPGG